MKRLFWLIALLLLAGTSLQGVAAQDATPVAGNPLLEGLGYPVIEFTTDGKTLTGPSELAAGRYLMKVTNTSDMTDWDVTFYSPGEGMTAGELLDGLLAVDTTADAPPDFYFQVGLAGGVESPDTEAVVQLTAGDWVAAAMYFGGTESAVAAQPVTVTGDLPDYSAIDGSVAVTLADMSITIPDAVPAGPQIWEVTNTGALPHFVYVMNPGGPITTEEAVNGVKLFFGSPDATPAAEGTAQDPMTWQDVAGSATITNGNVSIFEIDLEPGTYIAFCFVQGPGDLGSHALAGMTTVFTVA